MKKLLLVCLIWLFSVSAEGGAYRYTYTGPELEDTDPDYPVVAPHLSGYFEVAESLPPNLISAKIRPQIFSFTDGVNILDQSSSRFVLDGSFKLSTDNDGNLTGGYTIFLRSNTFEDGHLITMRITSSGGEESARYCLLAGNDKNGNRWCLDESTARSEQLNGGGSWEGQAVAVSATTSAFTLNDINNDSVAEIALLRAGSVRIEVRDGKFGPLIGTKAYLGSPYYPVSSHVIADLGGNNFPEIAALGIRYDGRKKVAIRDSSTGMELSNFDVLENRSFVIDAISVSDLSGNGLEDIALLHGPVISVSIYEAATGDLFQPEISYLTDAWPGGTPSLRSFLWADRLVSLPDLDGDGVDELGVFAERRDGRFALEIREADGTGGFRRIWFSGGIQFLDIAVGADADNNEVPEVVALGTRISDGRIVVERRNASGAPGTTRHWFFPDVYSNGPQGESTKRPSTLTRSAGRTECAKARQGTV
jgi:hypothetical protein